MTHILPLKRVGEEDRPKIGDKAFALASLQKGGFPVPRALCVTTDVYDTYVSSTGLRERIQMEIHRKAFADMRWEEMWDASLRIRNMFLTTPIPGSLKDALGDMVGASFGENPVAVRSSAPGEDSAKASFAGLHESYVNVRGAHVILEHVLKVWASLWSDAALLYRRELGLDPAKSTMAVVIQEMVFGDRSGVVFSRSPMDPSQSVIESVHGLNQGLVDGTVEPDRWTLDGISGDILSHRAPDRDLWVTPTEDGATLADLPPEIAPHSPLNDEEVGAVYRTAMSLETHFGSPQDVEWTFRGGSLHLLQSRPITTGKKTETEDERSWYLSLSRTFDNLRKLRRKIEEELIPAMIREASHLESMDLNALSPKDLAHEVERRSLVHKKWVETYWRDFIPFAHGARLFGQVYNDAVHPSDPYEFMTLLTVTEMESLKRNRLIEDIAQQARENPEIRHALETGDTEGADPSFLERLDGLMSMYGRNLCTADLSSAECRVNICRILLQMTAARPTTTARKDLTALTESFLSRFEGKKKEETLELLELARASYQLRDDDNLYLGRIESELDRAIAVAEKVLFADSIGKEDRRSNEELIARAGRKAYVPQSASPLATTSDPFDIRPRQLTGQPAGPGLAKGPARVVAKASGISRLPIGGNPCL